MTAAATVRFEIVDVTEDADLRRQLSEALADVDQLRKTADTMARALHEAHERDTRLTSDLNTAAMGRIAACGEVDRLCVVAADFGAQRDEARDERDRISAICKKAIAERDEARKAVEERKAVVARWADIRDAALTERDTARAENERLRGELANRVRIHVDEVSAERDRLRAAVEQLSRTPDALRGELGIARESLRLCRRELSEVDRKLRDANADRDRAIAERDAARTERRACEAECELLRKENCGLRDDVEGAIAERDEARKALADRGGVTLGIYANACRTRDEAFAELAALRARVAELEGEAASRETVTFVTADGWHHTAHEYLDLVQRQIVDLEGKLKAREERIFTLCDRINRIGALATCD